MSTTCSDIRNNHLRGSCLLNIFTHAISCSNTHKMSVLKKERSIIRFLSIIICISFTKANGSSCRKPQAFRKLQYQPGNVTTILNTVHAQTRLQCIASCLEDNNCTMVTFDEATHVCNLLPSDVTPPSLPTSVGVYSMYEPSLSCGAEDTGIKEVFLGGASRMKFVCHNGWIVIQNRENHDVNFTQNSQSYAHGFGDKSGDFWWGLLYLYALTSIRPYKLRIEMEQRVTGDFFVVEYSSFEVTSAADGYALSTSRPSGNASDGLASSNGMKFSTFDNDQDTRNNKNCATVAGGSGWWFSNCYGNADGANLNGPSGQCTGSSGNICILWLPIEPSSHLGLQNIRMMIK